MMEALCSSETPVLTKATWRYIPEDGILQLETRYAQALNFGTEVEGNNLEVDISVSNF
jgi:hypothetical protein